MDVFDTLYFPLFVVVLVVRVVQTGKTREAASVGKQDLKHSCAGSRG